MALDGVLDDALTGCVLACVVKPGIPTEKLLVIVGENKPIDAAIDPAVGPVDAVAVPPPPASPRFVFGNRMGSPGPSKTPGGPLEKSMFKPCKP